MSCRTGWVYTSVVMAFMAGLAGCAAPPRHKTVAAPSGGDFSPRSVRNEAWTKVHPTVASPRASEVIPVGYVAEQPQAPVSPPLAPMPQSPASTPTASVQPDTLDLTQYVNEVLSKNRSLAAMIAAWRAAAQKYPQAIALDDPMFTTMQAPGSWTSSNVTPAYVFGGSQKIPWRGKRPLRGEVAQAEADAACHDVGDTRLQLTEAAQLAYFEYYLVHRQTELNAANITSLTEFRDTARQLYEANRVSQQDVLQAEVELAEGARRQFELERMRRVAVARLNTLVHQPPDFPVPSPPRDLSASVVPAPPELLRQVALQQRPDLAALGAKIRADSATLALAYKEYFPDFELMGRYDSFWQPFATQGALQGQVGLNMNVPIYLEKRRAAVREAIYKLNQQRAEFDQRIDDINQQVETAYAQVVEMRSIVDLYSQRTMPAAVQNVSTAQADYVAGKGDLLRLVAAQRQLIMLREKQQEAVAGYLARLAELERAVGGNLPMEPGPEPVPPGVR